MAKTTLKRSTLAAIADKGNDLDTLRKLRHTLAANIDRSESGRDIAALSRQLQLVMKQIADLEKKENKISGMSVLDSVREKHALQIAMSGMTKNQDEKGEDE